MAISRRYQRIAFSLVFFYALFYLSYHFRAQLLGNASLGDLASKNSYGTSPVGSDSGKSEVVKTEPEEKELVVASLKGDDTSWLDEHFKDWKKNVYVVDDPTASLTVKKNKGREAMPFLT